MTTRICSWWLVLAMATGMVPNALGEGELRLAPATLHFSPRFILEAVAREMNVVLNPDVPLPQILFGSVTPLRRFQKAVAPQWGFSPHLFSNAYVVETNEIYLTDDAAYYARHNRTLDDSLAHEFVHYLQARYLRTDFTDSSIETDAVAVQKQFRERYAVHLLREAVVATAE